MRESYSFAVGGFRLQPEDPFFRLKAEATSPALATLAP
jgi:hypothetical protein